MTGILRFLAWIIASIGMGYCLGDICARRDDDRSAGLLIFLGFGQGLGISSCVYFISLLLFGGRSLAFLWIDIVLFTALLLLRIFVFRRQPSHTPPPSIPYRDALVPIVAIVGAAFLLTAVLRSSTFIHGGWDAWTFWNLRARWIFRSGADWSSSAFSPLLANSDYPLFVPSTIVQGWNLLGTETVFVPVLAGLGFVFATVGLLFATIWKFGSPVKAMLGVLALLATPVLIELGAYQYADVPVAFFILATIALLGLYDSDASRSKTWPVMAGISAGLCCWTKNEGMLFLGCVVIARMLTSRFVGLRTQAMELMYFGIGALGPLAILFYFHHTYAPPTAMFGTQTAGGLVSQIFDGSRHAVILPAFIRSFIAPGGFGNWRLALLPFLILYATVAGIDDDRRHSRFVWTSIAVLLLMAGGYYAVYLAEGLPTARLQQHLDTSLNRLLFQLWPLLLLSYFLVFRSPLPKQSAETLRLPAPTSPS